MTKHTAIVRSGPYVYSTDDTLRQTLLDLLERAVKAGYPDVLITLHSTDRKESATLFSVPDTATDPEGDVSALWWNTLQHYKQYEFKQFK